MTKKTLSLNKFRKTRKKVNKRFMIDNYGNEFKDNQYPEFYYVYGIDGFDGYIEILDQSDGNIMEYGTGVKYFLNISNWDDVSNDLEYLEEKLYSDHYLNNI